MKSNGEKIAALTAYDATFAGLLANAGVDLSLAWRYACGISVFSWPDITVLEYNFCTAQ